MSQPKRYVKRPVEISAFELRQYGDFVRARDWVNANGGSAAFAPGVNDDHLLVETLEGTSLEARAGWFIIQGVKGEFYPCEGEIFRLTYEVVQEPVEVEPFIGTGSHIPRRPDGSKRLVGGAAKQLPNV